MSDDAAKNLCDVSESLLFTLYFRAMESQRPDALIKDGKAVALVRQMSADGLYDFSRIKLLRMSETNKLVYVLRSRQFDRYAQDFLGRHSQAVAVHIGCGLDSRIERVDNSQVEWYDLDLPNVVELRRKYLGGERPRYHILSCSVLDSAWIEAVRSQRPRPFLFLAEGVFMYLEDAQVKSLVLTLLDSFPGAELVFDIYSPIHVLRHNLQTSISGLDIPMRWGIWHGREVERWSGGIHLLDEWGYFESPEPRLAPIQWLRPIESLVRTVRIYHFELGKATE